MLIKEDLINSVVLTRLTTIAQNDRLAHAYLFAGPKGSGKNETALAFAQLIICAKPDFDKAVACQTCAACVKILSGNHPDVVIVQSLEDSDTIKIEQIRDLLGQTRLRPFEARKKVFIIKNVEHLTLDGANAFLKTLEEPSASNLLLLTTSHLDKNLDTIRSRCHIVPFLAAPKRKLASQLQKDYDVDASSAFFLASFAQGCLGEAKALYEAKVHEHKDEVIDGFLLTNNSDMLIKKVLSDKKATKHFLDILLIWTRDCWLVKSGGPPGSLVFGDRLKDIEKFEKRFNAADLKRLTDEIVNASKLLAENLNVKIPLLIIKELIWAK